MTYREAYETWLKEFADDRATVDELKAIAGDEKEIEDRFYTELSFGTAGMRGVLGAGTNRMNLYNVRRATKGFADYINSQNAEHRQRGVVIAYDSRRMSPEFAKASALVLCHEGVKRVSVRRAAPGADAFLRGAPSALPSRASSSPPATTRRSITATRSIGRTARRCRRSTPIRCIARIRANRYEDAVDDGRGRGEGEGAAATSSAARKWTTTTSRRSRRCPSSPS